MNTFTWRGMSMRSEGTDLVAWMNNSTLERFSFPQYVKQGYAMDQNTIVVMLEDGSLWQCGGVPTGPLVLAAAAAKDVFDWLLETIERLAPNTYGQLIQDLNREFGKILKEQA